MNKLNKESNVSFNTVGEVPVFPGCEELSEAEKRKYRDSRLFELSILDGD